MGIFDWLFRRKNEIQPPIKEASPLYTPFEDPTEKLFLEWQRNQTPTATNPIKNTEDLPLTPPATVNINLMPSNDEEINNTPQANPPEKRIATAPPTAVHAVPAPAKDKPVIKNHPKQKTDKPYNDLFPWVYSSAEYKRALDSLSKKKITDNCCLCGKPCNQNDWILTDGHVLHEACYEKAHKEVPTLKTRAAALDYFKKNPAIPISIKLIHTYWGDYPPDWDSLRSVILQQANKACEDCGETEDTLHVHHVLPLSVGGSNRPDNLKCLCFTCHQTYHANFNINPSITYPKKAKQDTPYQEKIRTIKQCIAEKEDFSFHYRDYSKKETDRIVTPHEVTQTPPGIKRTGALYVRGYCHLRNEERTFKISRMSKLTVP